MTGQELESLTEAQLVEAVARVNIFARTSPEHKLRLVRALQAAFAHAPPLQVLFGTDNPGVLNLLFSFGFGVFLLLMVELEKWVSDRFFNSAGLAKSSGDQDP